MNYDKILIKILLNKNDTINGTKRRKIQNKYPNILHYINSKFNDSKSLIESINRIKYNIKDRPICKYCGKEVKYISKNIYKTYCSVKCMSNDTRDIVKEKFNEHPKYIKDQISQKRKDTCFKRYGVEYVLQDKSIRKRIQNTCLEKYGVINGGASKQAKDKIKKTCLEKYGVETPLKSKEIQEKCKETLRQKYGVETPLKSKEIQEKCKETLRQKYGVETPLKSKEIQEKLKQTCLKKYGVECSLQSEDIKNKSKETCLNKYGVKYITQTDLMKKKSKQTCLKKYGVPFFVQSKKFEEEMELTKRKNNTWTTSKVEEELYLYIKERFPSVKRQYKDKTRYPYFCDFYIPELDYFIELQGYYTHGKEPYNPNSIKHQVLVQRYKERYGPNCQAITIWTIRDVEKRNCAKDHNLKFKEVWSLNEGKEFIDFLYGK